MVSSKKKWTVMNPIRRQMKKRNPSSEQNGQLVHWWLLIHSGPLWATYISYNRTLGKAYGFKLSAFRNALGTWGINWEHIR
jgi:hypothetical protein